MSSENKYNSLERCKPLLGTYVEVTLSGLVDDQSLIKASQNVFRAIERIHNMMNFHDIKSELSQLNRKMLISTNIEHEVSSELYTVIAMSVDLHQKSGGLFDPTSNQFKHLAFGELTLKQIGFLAVNLGNLGDLSLSGSNVVNTKHLCINLSGIAKGYAVDYAINSLPKGIDYIINAGGDIAMSDWQNKAINVKYSKLPWAVKRHKMKNCAVATSGNYYHSNTGHIVNPVTKKNHAFKGSVTVFAPQVVLADALTKVVLLMKRSEAKLILKAFNAYAIRINRLGLAKQV